MASDGAGLLALLVECPCTVCLTHTVRACLLAENQRDSASEPDEEDLGDPWLKLFDSTRRMYYWQNFTTNELTYDEPEDPLAHEKGLIGHRVKVYWVVQVTMRSTRT
jgi:hypothetical protein